MLVYRLSRTRWANDLSGEGSRLFGGRWNRKGSPCIYTSASRALALLEYTVNVEMNDIPRALSMISIDIPDAILHTFDISDLPGDWQSLPAPSSTKDFGTALLQTAAHPVIRLPSVILPEEFNYLLNPMHPDSRLFRIVDIKDFSYDIRIKQN